MVRTRYILRRNRKLKGELASNDNALDKKADAPKVEYPPKEQDSSCEPFLPAA